MAKSNRLDDVHERFEDVLKERNDMIKSERIYRQRIRQLEEELKGMVNQCQVLSDENKELRKALDAAKTIDDSSKSFNSKPNSAQLERENANLAAEHDAKAQMDSLINLNTKFRNENLELENKVRDLEKQIASQVKSLESTDKQKVMEATIQDLHTTITSLQQEIIVLETKFKSVDNDNKTLNDSLENKRKEFAELTRALQTETMTEADLKATKEQLEKVQQEYNRVRQELADTQILLRDSETSKQKLQEQLTERDKQIEMANLDIDTKEKLILDLRKDVEVNKQVMLKLEVSNQTYKTMEAESHDLTSKINILQAEIDKILAENHNLKRERDEITQTIDKLRQENSDSAEAVRNSKTYLINWEYEKEYRAKVEIDLSEKKEQNHILQVHVKEAESKIKELSDRILSLEEERVRLGNTSMSQLESDNRVLKDGNMKLRQMLVERNIELTNTKHEQLVSDFRIRDSERTQKNRNTRVQKLSQKTVLQKSAQESRNSDEIKSLSNKSYPQPEPFSRTSFKNVQGPNMKQNYKYKEHFETVGNISGSQSYGNRVKMTTDKHKSTNMKEATNRLIVEERKCETSSLPVLEVKSTISPQLYNGYFALYKDKQKRIQEKGY